MKKAESFYISLISVLISLSIVSASAFSVIVTKKPLKKSDSWIPVPTTTVTTTTTTTTTTTEPETDSDTYIYSDSDLPQKDAQENTVNVPAVKVAGFLGPYNIDGELPEKQAVSGNYFDDAVFIGDSISVMLSYYEGSADRLGKAQFLTSGSLGASNALWNVSNKSVHPKYNGQKMRVEDAVAQMGAKKVYIMLGMNDIKNVGVNNGIKNFETLCNLILQKSPDVKIYVQSVTPIAETSSVATEGEGKLNNTTVNEYNKRLASLSASRGWYFINVASVMFNEQGYLKNEYCSDLSSMGIHFTTKGCKVWVDYLLTHTP